MRNFSRVVVGVVTASALLVPVFSSAITSDELRSQINTLLAQIVLLQQKIVANATTPSTTTTAISTSTTASTAPSTGVVCPVFNLTLSHGSRGEAVTALQKFLATKGFLVTDGATGFFGDLTESAVRNFQAQQGIMSSGSAATTGWGTVGKLTSAAIVRVCSATPATPTASSCSYNPIPTTSCNGTWTPSFSADNCITSWKCAALTACPAITRAACPAGQHYQFGATRYDVSGCGIQDASCVSDTNPIACPAVIRASCPVGQHYQYGAMNYDANGCGVQSAKCVADAACPSVAYGTDCAQGYHAVGGGTDASGCQLAPKCVADTSATFSASPSSGGAPLNVIFSASNSGTNVMSVDFGDGSSSDPNIGCSGTPCSVYWATSHTYKTTGTYAAKLWGVCIGDSFLCGAAANGGRPLLGTATITVSGQCQVSVIQVDCIQGTHYTGTTYTTDSNGCQVPHAGQCIANATDLVVTAESDVHNPVTIQGPQKLTDAFNACVYSIGWQGWSGNGIRVDWGDGTSAPLTPYSSTNAGTSCTAEKSHLYTKAGTYTITASLWHPGPTDAPITDWQGTATVLIHAGIGSATNNSANYANALTALESILNKILGR
ncbi:MAG: protein of unknown function with transrane region [Candidatus Kaiserbacteria bacterium]|nr:protein of unknown function with transrane region [Candidatus Kaiserbacteria bacterium]